MDRSPRFPETLWSLVVHAADRSSAEHHQALEKLCCMYWYPVYAYVRRRGHDVDAARDLTQEFFARLVEKNYVASADHDRGRFRGFLLKAVQRFLLNQSDRDRAQKRGGGVPAASIEVEAAEGRYQREPRHDVTPETMYERRCALTILERTMARMRDREESKRFDAMAPFLAGDGPRGAYESAAAALGISEGAFKVAVHRLRQRYRESLHAEIAETVRDESEVEGEIRHLMEVLGRSQRAP
ncbi:MAG: RNA polymerase sigma factor [Bryobacteraceae bacterium]